MSYGLPEQNQLAITTCSFCGTQLSYPVNSYYIQCPKCSSTMNPRTPQLHYVNCVNCSTLLSHPPHSLAIQCPKCDIVMSLSDRPMEMQQPPPIPQAPIPPPVPQRSQPPAQPPPSQGSQGRKPHKKRKDPNAPKRASNAYMIFCKERRAQLKREHPELPFGKVGAQLGEIWRNFTPEEKKPYEDRAAVDRDRYKRDMEYYQTDPSNALPSESPKDKKPKVENLVKKREPTAGAGPNPNMPVLMHNPPAMPMQSMPQLQQMPSMPQQQLDWLQQQQLAAAHQQAAQQQAVAAQQQHQAQQQQQQQQQAQSQQAAPQAAPSQQMHQLSHLSQGDDSSHGAASNYQLPLAQQPPSDSAAPSSASNQAGHHNEYLAPPSDTPTAGHPDLFNSSAPKVEDKSG